MGQIPAGGTNTDPPYPRCPVERWEPLTDPDKYQAQTLYRTVMVHRAPLTQKLIQGIDPFVIRGIVPAGTDRAAQPLRHQG